MNFDRSLKNGAITFIIGIILILLLVNIFSGLTAISITDSDWTYGTVAIVLAFLFLGSVIVVCTSEIVYAIKDRE